MSAFFKLGRLALGALMIATGVAQAEPVRLIFAGDVMLDDGPGKVVESGRDPLAYFGPILADADLAVANLECPIATGGKALENKIYAFRAHPRVLPIVKAHFGAMSVANNHSGDFGRGAFLETLDFLQQSGIPYFGGGRDVASAHKPLWVERQGLRIALLGYNEFKPRSFEAGPDWPGVAWSEDSQVITDIRAARAAGADLVIPFMHWGWEREPQPSERQRQLARAMIDAGADVVIGGHPHVTQGAEYYRGRLIVYSLGNFVFDGFESPEAKLGWVLRLTMDKGGLIAWDTLAAAMDGEGIPRPVPGALTPCGKAGDSQVQLCPNLGVVPVK